MNASTVRRVIWLSAVIAVMAAIPSESQAIFHWFGCNSCGSGTTAYRPATTAPPFIAAQPMASSCQTCNYMPQTCYRTVLQQVPVTTYRPVAACGPCGTQVTAMRPVVTYQTQARLVPYTTYRPVYAPMSFAPAVACPTGGCASAGCPTGGCGSTVSYAPYAASAPVTSGCSSCNATPAPSYSSPAYTTPVPSYSPAPSYTPAPPSSGSRLQTPTPALTPTEPMRPQTFQQDDRGVTEGQSLRPIPDEDREQPSSKKTNSTLAPRLLDQDRTTYVPLKYDVIPVSAADTSDANDGWRAARR